MKTTTLEMSKLLRDVGFPQDTAFYWREDITNASDLGIRYGKKKENMWEVLIAAPTADEVLDLLPERIEGYKSFGMGTLAGEWHVGYQKMGNELQAIKTIDSVLANAAAKMWLYLKKEGLI